MSDIVTDTLIRRTPVVIRENIKAWGYRLTNQREYSLLEALVKLNVTVCNEGSINTFRKDTRESIIAVTRRYAACR